MPATLTTARVLLGSSSAGTRARPIETAVVAKPSAGKHESDWPSARYPDHFGPGGFSLKPEHRSKHKQVRNEVGDDRHADQHVVGSFHAGACLAEEDECRRDPRLGQEADVGRAVPGMQPPECGRQETVDSGHERQPATGSKPGACLAEPADNNESAMATPASSRPSRRRWRSAIAVMNPCRFRISAWGSATSIATVQRM